MLLKKDTHQNCRLHLHRITLAVQGPHSYELLQSRSAYKYMRLLDPLWKADLFQIHLLKYLKHLGKLSTENLFTNRLAAD